MKRPEETQGFHGLLAWPLALEMVQGDMTGYKRLFGFGPATGRGADLAQHRQIEIEHAVGEQGPTIVAGPCRHPGSVEELLYQHSMASSPGKLSPSGILYFETLRALALTVVRSKLQFGDESIPTRLARASDR